MKQKEEKMKTKSVKGKFAIGALLLLLLGGGAGFGLGGNGLGLFNSNDKAAEEKEDSKEDGSLQNEAADRANEEDLLTTDLITVKINEDKVYVQGKEFENEADFKAYIEGLNNDERSFCIEQEQAIQATYEWVVNALDDLKVRVISNE